MAGFMKKIFFFFFAFVSLILQSKGEATVRKHCPIIFSKWMGVTLFRLMGLKGKEHV